MIPLWLKNWWYGRGHRPGPRSPMYSPTLAWVYGMEDALRAQQRRAER